MSDPTDPAFDPDLFDDDDERRRSGERKGKISDLLRKTIENTVGSVENAGTVSREALSYIIEQGDRGRKEVLRIFAAEVGSFLKNTDLSREVTKVLTSVQLDVSASIRFREVESGRNVEVELEDKHVRVKSAKHETKPPEE